MNPDIAFAASAREWPDRLHRFVLDHGGGRIVDRVMGPDQAVDADFDVLIIDDVCSFLTPRLVEMVKARGREVVGVYAPEDGSSAKRRLLECGISDVIETGATPEEFISKISATLAHRVVATGAAPSSGAPLTIGVTGPCAGVGITEISIALARSLTSTHDCVLIDLDPVWPSVVQRLDLPVHPNIRTALDHALHRPERLVDAIHLYGELRVIGGRADGGSAESVSRHETVSLLAGLAGWCEVVVIDLGPEPSSEPSLLREMDSLLMVSTADPVGVSRLIRTADRVMSRNPALGLLAIANRTPLKGFHRAEVITEIQRALPDLTVTAISHDKKAAGAVWNGQIDYGQRFSKEVSAIARLVSGVIGDD